MSAIARMVLGAVMLLACQAATAQWWNFGRADDEPRISELKLNKVDATRLVDSVVMSRDELPGGLIVARGRAEVGTGVIGIIEYSLDGGQTWRGGTLGDRGLFTFEIRPEIERVYRVIVRAVSTVGRQSRDEDHSFRLQVTGENASEGVRQAFLRMIDLYQRKNRAEMMRGVSDFFEGNVISLEDALRNDFANFDNIQIQPNISRITSLAGVSEVAFTFNRQVYSVRNARVLRDQAASSMSFRREEGGFRLVRLAAPLIFGVSNPTEVATTVTQQSVGQPVLTVNASTGAAAVQAQPATAPASVSAAAASASTVETGTVTLTFNSNQPPPPPATFSYKSFTFLNATQTTDTTVPAAYAFTGDFMIAGTGNLFTRAGDAVRTCGTNFASLTVAP
ncbi:MAG: hypothetical protein Q7V62_08300, partial [Actinomycetota bacterium]|nr:hypothetical protein [Actinomycetota bacterium]